MKKNILRVSALTLIIILLMAVSGAGAFAAQQYVYDPVYLLNDEEFSELNDKAARISETYGCGVHFVITDDPQVNSDTIQEYSEDMYLESPALGYGESKDGFLLVLGTYDRCYWLLAYGPYGNYALTDYGKDWMSENFLGYFGVDDWYGGFDQYLTDCEYVLQSAAEGTPVDVYYDDMGAAEAYPAGGLIGLVTAFITCRIFKRQMSNVGRASRAEDYLDVANVEILHRSDRFVRRDVVRRKRESEKKEGSRGGTTVNSRGFSGKGGKF